MFCTLPGASKGQSGVGTELEETAFLFVKTLRRARETCFSDARDLGSCLCCVIHGCSAAAMWFVLASGDFPELLLPWCVAGGG